MPTPRRSLHPGAASLAWLCLCLGACNAPLPPAADWPFEAAPRQWRLPAGLDEISGLALDGNGRLFGHDDEHAVIYEIDRERGTIVKRFSLGEPLLTGDFEDLAIAGDDFFLLTSDGVLHRFREGTDGAAVACQDLDTGLGARCELEGLAWDAAASRLWLACKTVRDPALAGRVAVFAFDPVAGRVDDDLSWSVDEATLAQPTGRKRFEPSAVEPTADGGFMLLSGRQRALAAVGPGGIVTHVWRLDPARHRQPEGLVIARNGDLLISDEGHIGRARLTLYRKR